MDRTLFKFPTVPPDRETQQALMYPPGWPGTFETCYVAAWYGLVDDLDKLEAKHVEPMLRSLDGDNLGMAGQGASKLIEDRPDLHEAICEGLDNVLNPDKWLRDHAALDELMGDIEGGRK